MTKNEPDLKKLREEILQLSDAIKNTAVSKDSACALVRFCLSSQSSLDTLLQEMELPFWQTFPLPKETYPNLFFWQKQLEKLQYEKDHDPLTLLPNRRYFDYVLKKEIRRSIRHKTSLSLCILDIDNFKTFNDSYGHACGDEILRVFGSILKKEVREIDLPARIGGEEFAILLPGTNIFQAQKTLARIQSHTRAAEIHCPDQQKILHTTCSLGLTCFKGKNETNADQEIFQLADQAMYLAKKNGKDRIEILLPKTNRPETTSMVLHAEKQFLFARIKEK